jgi:hypothetical protein
VKAFLIALWETGEIAARQKLQGKVCRMVGNFCRARHKKMGLDPSGSSPELVRPFKRIAIL